MRASRNFENVFTPNTLASGALEFVDLLEIDFLKK